ncbi:hypothetical protein [Streptomyces pseudovenezuelae]|uniref:hypothetical protein n=1 Tax=Streptomyces pseudovenezuelae TaxID=67350 RepID=UPI0024737085|nr:hypothetical protein [Streptomyces pseudovenezuelae]
MTFPSLQLHVLFAVFVFAAVYVGVVLPAVWSRRPTRRSVALKVLVRLLGSVRRGRGRQGVARRLVMWGDADLERARPLTLQQGSRLRDAT